MPLRVSLFTTLLQRLVPLYFIVAAGFFAGRKLKVDRDSIAKLTIYLVSPIVVFTNVSQIDLKPEFLAVPFAFAVVCSTIAVGFLRLARAGGKSLGLEGPTGNLLAFTSGDANTGYFGLPVAMMLFGQEIAGVYLLFCLGFLLYENSVGFYILARGNATTREAFLRLAKLPAFYAFVFAILASLLRMKITGVYSDFSGFFRGAYTVLGMMLVGLGVAELRSFRFDWKFVSMTFLAKFFVWPVLVGAFVLLDRCQFHLYEERAHQMMLLIACTPLAANTVGFATLLKIEPEKAGVAVLLSTFFALVFIPFVVGCVF